MVEDGAKPRHIMSPPSAFKHGPMEHMKPICHRIVDAFRYNGKGLQKKNVTKATKDVEPLTAVFQPVIAEAYANKKTNPRGNRIQSISEYTEVLYKKRPRVSVINSASGSTDTKVRQAGHGRFGKAFDFSKQLLHQQKAKASMRCAETLSKSVEGRSTKDPKCLRGRIRNAFQETIRLLHKNTSKDSCMVSQSPPLSVERCINVNLEARNGGLPSIPCRCPPLLREGYIEEPISQGNLDLAKGGVEEVYNKVIQKLEGALTAMSQEHRAFVELVVRKGIQALKIGVPASDED